MNTAGQRIGEATNSGGMAWQGQEERRFAMALFCEAKAEKRIGSQRNSKAVNSKIMICKGFDMKGNGNVLTRKAMAMY